MGSPLQLSDVSLATERAVREGVLRALAYADVFGHPLTAEEAHRYLAETRAERDEVRTALDELVPSRVSRHEGLYCLREREAAFENRARRERHADRLWPVALEWAEGIATLPFVRMVAVTGSLARDAAEEGGDIDLLVVVGDQRLWACRAMIGLLTRRARRAGVELCANYLLAADRLALEERDVYTAHELAQMVPLVGIETYRRLREANAPWLSTHLPNAGGVPTSRPVAPLRPGRARRAMETMLRTPPGRWLDGLERRRKRAVALRAGLDLSEARFDPHCFKGHFDGHGRRVLAAYQARLRAIGLAGEKGGP